MRATFSATDAEGNATTLDLSATVLPRFPGDPGRGALYFGMSRQGGDPAAREAQLGHRVGIFRSYFQSTQVDSLVSVCKRDLAAGRLPLTSTKLPGTWADMAAGRYDSWLSGLFSKLAAAGGPVWLCLHHEPYDDNPTGGSDYKAMYRHAYAMKPGNVALVPILQSYPFDPYGSPPQHGDLSAWYDPAGMDVCGIDNYNHWSGNPPNGKPWRTPQQVLGIFDLLAAFGKPIVLAEHGVRTDPASPGKAAQWMTDVHDISVTRRDVVGISYFDSSSNVTDGGSPWSLDDQDAERLDAFRRLLTTTGSAYR